MRLFPRTIAGQVTLVLFLGIITLQGVTALLLTMQHHSVLRQGRDDRLVQRTIAMYRLISVTPPALQRPALRASHTQTTRFTVSPTPIVASAGRGRGEAFLTRIFTRRIQNLEVAHVEIGHRLEPRIWRDDANTTPDRWRDSPSRDRQRDYQPQMRRDREHKGPRFWNSRKWREKDNKWRQAKAVAVSLQLPNGQWLNVRMVAAPPPKFWGWSLLIGLAVALAVTLVLSVILVRRISRPLSTLAEAVRRFGRGATASPLAATGPLDVQAVTLSFNQMQERLSRFVQDRTRMLAAISHDLRTPITTLRLRAEFIDDPVMRQKMLDTLDEMQAMIEASLSFAREEANKETAKPVDIAALVQTMTEDMQEMGHDVTYTGPDSLIYVCRHHALRRALRNIAENAVRYGERARMHMQDMGEQVMIRIEDDGPGIPAERMEDMFSPFVRLEESRNQETGGIGLGLSIARTIIRSHGGEITLKNRPENGLEVSIELPIA